MTGRDDSGEAPIPPMTDTDVYVTAAAAGRSFLGRLLFSSPKTFYLQAFSIVVRARRKALRGEYDRRQWAMSSREIVGALENVGVRLEVTGCRTVASLDGPVVFVGNHMSTLETFVLPCFIAPHRPATFVVKESLLTYPVFGPVMRARKPVAVRRINPREDLSVVFREGQERLAAGVSMIIFPQTTRTQGFDPSRFNTLGVKLAARAGVPVVPIAVRTDAWGNGKHFKDFGPINPDLPVHMAFGPPIPVEGKGTEAHEQVLAFIENRLVAWGLG